MKIPEMLQREDFYDILPKTLNKHAAFLGIAEGSVAVIEKGRRADLYVNERLNAIVSEKPSKDVKEYLYTEYSVGGGFLRRSAVATYLWAGTTLVRSLSQRGIVLQSDLPLHDVLIYPCNKKIRLFDFSSGMVHTVLKDGYPDDYLKREVAFRQEMMSGFVPGVVKSSDGCYTECIIRNGKPLARIRDLIYVEKKKKESLDLLLSLTNTKEYTSSLDYITYLKARCLDLVSRKKGFDNALNVISAFDKLLATTQDCEFELVTSHGDFQPGNIWIDTNGRILIIDWETVKKRSPYYDYAALYCQLRNHGGLHNLCNRISADQYMSSVKGIPVESIVNVILAEELEYQTEELLSLPNVVGLNQYNTFISELNTLLS